MTARYGYPTALSTLAVMLLAVTATVAGGARSAVAANNAKQHYVRECLRCHGARGDGDGGVVGGAPGRIKPHSLADCSWMNMMSDATLFLAIKNGGPAIGLGAEMPAWGSRLSDQEISELVLYIRSFCGRGDRREQLPALARMAISAH